MKKRIWLRGILTLGLVILAGAALIPHPNLLLTRARKASFTAEHIGYEPIVWHSDHERYVLHQIEKTDHFGVFIEDLNTGSLTPVKSFNEAFASQLAAPKTNPSRRMSAQAGAATFDPGTRGFSPDHKWLLWRTKALNGKVSAKHEAAAHAYSLDGKTQQHWNHETENQYRTQSFCWLADSKRWVNLRWDNTFCLNGVTIHSLDTPNADVTKTFVNHGSHWALGITPDAHLLSYDPYIVPPSPSPPSLVYYDTPLDDNAPISRKITIPLPAEAHFYNVYLSPDGARFLWHLAVQPRLPGLPLIQQLFARLGMQTERQEGLWISKRDGSDMHELGHVPMKPAPPQGNSRQWTIQQRAAQQVSLLRAMYSLHHIQWLPDGKQIMFAQGNDVYTLSIE